MQQINITDQPYGFGSALKGEITIPSNYSGTEIKFGECFDNVKDKFIHGVKVLMQSRIDGVVRKDKSKTPLLSRAAMATAHVKFSVNGHKQVDLPLDVLGYDPDVHNPNTFCQLVMPEGFNVSDSTVKLDSTTITEKAVIQFIFYVGPNQACMK